MLTTEQLAEFEKWGVLRIPGGIPVEAADTMRNLIWERLSTEHGIRPDARESWAVERPIGFKALEATELFQRTGAAVEAAVSAVLGGPPWVIRHGWRPLITFPVPGAAWEMPYRGWHYDKAYEPAELERVPGLNVFGLLAPTRPRGGGTVLLAGSHHLVRSYTLQQGGMVHSRVMKALLGKADPWLEGLWSPEPEGNRTTRYLSEGHVVDGVPVRVVELTGEPGDTFLMNGSLLHNAPPNALDTPRMMVVKRFARPASGSS